mgnify:CR=1 FL=1
MIANKIVSNRQKKTTENPQKPYIPTYLGAVPPPKFDLIKITPIQVTVKPPTKKEKNILTKSEVLAVILELGRAIKGTFISNVLWFFRKRR